MTLTDKGLSISGTGIGEWGAGTSPEIELDGGHKVAINTADSVFTRIETNADKSVLTVKSGVLTRPCFLKYTVSPSDKCTCTAVTDSTTRELTLTISSVTEDITLGIAFPDKHNISVAAEDGSMGEAYINTPGTASGSYYEGESLSLYAVPADGSHIFRKWSDGSTDNPRTFTAGTADATLTKEEWKYLFGDNVARDGRYKAGVTVCGKANCVVLVPDDWNLTENPLQSSYDETEWAAAEASGNMPTPSGSSQTIKEIQLLQARQGTGKLTFQKL